MNKNISTTIILLTLMLTSCSSSATPTGTGPAGNRTAVELPARTKLTLGIIKLEETGNAISTEQAAELLPMFYVLQDINGSGTAAQEEIDGLTAQILETLTDEQRQAMDSMSFSMQDVFAATQSSSGKSSTAGSSSTANIGGGMGGPPDMGGGGMPGGGVPSGGISTTSANSNTTAKSVLDTSTPTDLFDAVISLLEKKAVT